MLAPWAEPARAPQVAQASRIFTHAVEATDDVDGFVARKTRWLTAIAEHEQTRGTIVAGGRGVTRDGVIIEALEDLLGQGHPVEPELEAARGALEPHKRSRAQEEHLMGRLLVDVAHRLPDQGVDTRRRTSRPRCGWY